MSLHTHISSILPAITFASSPNVMHFWEPFTVLNLLYCFIAESAVPLIYDTKLIT